MLLNVLPSNELQILHVSRCEASVWGKTTDEGSPSQITGFNKFHMGPTKKIAARSQALDKKGGMLATLWSIGVLCQGSPAAISNFGP